MKYKIMIVDNNELVAKPLAKLLHSFGYEVNIVHSGQEALCAIYKFMPRVILLDIGMSGMNGYDVAKNIRQNEKFSETVLIAFTANNNMCHKQKARKAGFNHHISKPTNISEIVRILNVYDFN